MSIRILVVVSMFAVALLASGCKDGSSPSAPTTPAPAGTSAGTPAATTPQPRANAELELSGSYACTDPFCDFAEFTLRLRNSGGVGAHLNFIRMENRSGQPIMELGADHFINALGTNRIEAGQTHHFTLNAQLGYMLVIGYRDDNGVKAEVGWFTNPPR